MSEVDWTKCRSGKAEESSELLQGERLDMFVSQFGRLQDMLGDKMLPVLLRISLESTGTQLDNLARAEKFGWIDSVERRIVLRQVPTRMVHEYIMDSPKDLRDAVWWQGRPGGIWPQIYAVIFVTWGVGLFRATHKSRCNCSLSQKSASIPSAASRRKAISTLISDLEFKRADSV